MLNITRIPAPRVALVDSETGLMSREWFRFFNNIYTIVGADLGVIQIENGGTGLSTAPTNGQLLIGDTVNGYVLNTLNPADGITVTNGAGTITLTNTGVLSFSGGNTGLTPATATNGNVVISGLLNVASGGTNQSSYVDGELLIGNTTGNTLTKSTLTAGTAIGISNGAGAITITNTLPDQTVVLTNGTGISITGTYPSFTITNTSPSSGGTVTSITAGTGLTGGTITTSGTIAIDSTVATLTGTQTLTNKTLTSPKANEILDTNGNESVVFSPTTSATDYFVMKNGIGVGVPLHLYAEGSSANTGMHIQPKGTGLVTISDGTDFSKGIRFRSSSSAASAVTLLDAVSSAGRVVTLPDATTTLVGRDTTDTLTNKSISGATNTLSNIGNASLTNSTISGVALGGNLFNLTAGTGVSFSAGTTYNGSAAITINATGTGGTVTSVAALTLGTTGTDLSSTVANGTTTPVITLQVPTASAANRGALSSTDWSTFNGKAPGVTFTTNYIPYGQGTTTLNQSAGLQFDGTNFTTTGFATATSFRPSSSTIPTNGMYLPAANTVGIAANGTNFLNITSSKVLVGSATSPSGGSATLLVAANVGGGIQLANITGVNGALINSVPGAGLAFYGYTGAVGSETYTERMRMFSSGGVSIGNTTDPGATNLSVTGSVAAGSVSVSGVTTVSAGTAAAPSITTTGDTNTGVFFPAADTVAVATNGVEATRVDSAGRLGIGIAPAARLHSYNSAGGTTARLQTGTTANGNFLDYQNAGGTRQGIVGFIDSTNLYIHNDASANIIFDTNNTERMRIHASGGVSIGNTTDPGATNLSVTGKATIQTLTIGLGGGSVASNTALGNQALGTNVSGSSNTAVGSSSLFASTGTDNTAVGTSCLVAVSTGGNNVGLGSVVFQRTTTASFNTGVGRSAGRFFSGGSNTALGYQALLGVDGSSTGTNNTAIGFQAGSTLTTGSNNLLLGYQAAPSAITVSNEITIGNSSNTVIRYPLNYSTVANLPSASTVGKGSRTFVTDALAPAFGSTVVGAGAVFIPVYSDGTNWKVG